MPTPPLRLHPGRYLQSPVWHYRHPDTGRRVSLVGLVHEGEPRYYQAAMRLISDLTGQGAAVHHEGTRLGEFKRNPPAHASDLERELLALYPACTDTVHTVPGWVDQFTGIGGRWPEGWQRHDLDEIQIMRALGHELYRQYIPPAASAISGSPLRRWFVATQTRVMACWNYYKAAWGAQFPAKPTDPVFIDQRNEAALAGVDHCGQDLVVVWGCSHLPGIAEGLQRRGFAHAGTTWLTVGRLPRCSRLMLTSWSLLPVALCLGVAGLVCSRRPESRSAAVTPELMKETR